MLETTQNNRFKMFLKNITLENLMCLFIVLNPILDIISFLFRNYFKTDFSPSTIIRPVIPTVVFIILFFKEKNKKSKLKIGIIYFIFAIIHLIIFQKLHNDSSFGTVKNEMQYIINYSFMIINLYLFYKLVKNKQKLENAIFISTTIYIITLFFSIITKTSSPTYIEGIGYKGYFESGNSLCTVLILSVSVIFANITKKDIKSIILIIFVGIYLMIFAGMRTGLFGFGIICIIFMITKFFIKIKENIKFSKKQIIISVFAIVLLVIAFFVLGLKTLERRKLLKQNEINNIDEETETVRYVTGDILNLYKQIIKQDVPESYMSDEEQKAVVDLCVFAQKIKLSNVDLRKQQLIYNICLVKQQKSIPLILFGNGYKNQTGELVMEMEIPALLCNFGIIGFLLYFGPFGAIFIYAIIKLLKNIKKVDIQSIMYATGSGLAIALSTLSGYVYFNFSSMTIAIILNILLLRKVGEFE